MTSRCYVHDLRDGHPDRETCKLKYYSRLPIKVDDDEFVFYMWSKPDSSFDITMLIVYIKGKKNDLSKRTIYRKIEK